MRQCDPSLFGLGADSRFLIGSPGLGADYGPNEVMEFEAADAVQAEVMGSIGGDKIIKQMAKSLKNQVMKEAAAKAALTTAIGCMGPVGAVIAVLMSVAQMFSQKRVEKKQKAVMKGFSERMTSFTANEIQRVLIPTIEPVLDQEIRNASLLMSQGTHGLGSLKSSFKRIGSAMSKAPKKMGKGVVEAGKGVGDWASGQRTIDTMRKKVAAAEAELKPKITKQIQDKAAYFQTQEGRHELRQIAKSVLSQHPEMMRQVTKAGASSGGVSAPVMIAGAAAALLLTIGIAR